MNTATDPSILATAVASPSSILSTDAESIATLAREAATRPSVLTVTDPRDPRVAAPLLLLPDAERGVRVFEVDKHLDRYRTKPERRRGTARVIDLVSFMALTERFADEDSALFADPSPRAPSLTAVLDYHRKTAEGAPRFGDHRIVYPFPVSDEWAAWQTSNGKPMSQVEFAEFVENRILDVLHPSMASGSALELAGATEASFAPPSKLLELSRGLAVRVGQKVRNAANLSTGEMEVQYITEHEDQQGQPLRVPSAFLIGIPVFRNGDRYSLAARLRYRLREGTISWFYELFRADVAFDDAFKEACTKAHLQTGLPLYLGAPESAP